VRLETLLEQVDALRQSDAFLVSTGNFQALNTDNSETRKQAVEELEVL
jgi:hypothetical protein